MNFNKFINSDYLKNNPLCGIDTYKDELNLTTGACTRQIRKLVLTGDENWVIVSGKLCILKPTNCIQYSMSISTHFIPTQSAYNPGEMYVGGSYINFNYDGVNDNVPTFKSYLTNQYSAGTPVTVWYVLATPTTETIAVLSGLSGTVEGYLIQDGTPTPTNPIYPTANTVEQWLDLNHYIMGTSTDTLTTLPAVIHPTGTTATVGLKGNTLQSSIPSPTSPIMPQGTGDLETSGAKAGQYKIPISSANTTTPVYLGEVESTRKIKKLVLTGKNVIYKNDPTSYLYYVTDVPHKSIDCICSHLPSTNSYPIGETSGIYSKDSSHPNIMYINLSKSVMEAQPSGNTVAGFKEYLAQQYAAGTPVTVWYVLANEETAVVNEPLMRIGDYADEVSGISIPTITGADSFDVLTTLKPSEVELTYTGWHDATVEEWDGSQWNE